MGKVSKPKLGQNFLVDESAMYCIVDALGDTGRRTVIEIGPGHGALTGILAGRCKRLIGLEVDPSLAAELRFRFRDQSHVEIVEADVLNTDLATFTEPGATLDVIGNLPYYITSDILLHLFSTSCLGRAVLMMQREVADRVAASPGVRDYGLLSATTQMHAQVEALFTLPPSAFTPPPDVYSTVLRLSFGSRFAELGVDATGFDAFLKQAFAQKRKTLANNLRSAAYQPDFVRRSWPTELPLQARAEQVPLETMARMYLALRAAASTVQPVPAETQP